MNRHTRGPWFSNPVGFAIHAMTLLTRKSFVICDIRQEQFTSAEEDRANLLLISAAPELLAELKHAEFRCIGDTCPRCGHDDIAGHKEGCSLAAAIAKAQGEAK